MSKYFVIAILIILVIILSVQVFLVFKNERGLKSDLAQMQEKSDALAKENDDLQKQIDYYSRPENLEKELKSKFNYKNPGEQMMIIVQ